MQGKLPILRRKTSAAMLQLIREELGFGFLLMDTGKLFDDLVCVLPELFDPEIPVWLVPHRECTRARASALSTISCRRNLGLLPKQSPIITGTA
jgi:hypothetical protein